MCPITYFQPPVGDDGIDLCAGAEVCPSPRTENMGNPGTSMISKSQEETEVSERLEEKAVEAEMRRLG